MAVLVVAVAVVADQEGGVRVGVGDDVVSSIYVTHSGCGARRCRCCCAAGTRCWSRGRRWRPEVRRHRCSDWSEEADARFPLADGVAVAAVEGGVVAEGGAAAGARSSFAAAAFSSGV